MNIAGVAVFGTISGAPTRRVNRMYEVVNNLSRQAGVHAIKIGASLLYNDDRITFPRSVRGTYTFSSLTNFLNSAFIERNAGTGSDFFSVSARLARVFRLAGRLELEALAEGFNLTNRQNAVTRNTSFGPGAYPTNPLPTFGQITAVGEPRSFQFGARLRF